MIPDNDPDGLDRAPLLLAALDHEARIEDFRARVQTVRMIFFGTLFLGIVLGETLFATMLFAILAVEVLGASISGAAFALMVPTVIGMVHVKLHHEGDHFTKWWLSKLTTIGIPLFCLGISLSLGFAAWLAADDAVNMVTSAPEGRLGDAVIAPEASASSGIAGWLAMIPNMLLFLGLSFGMIISVALASHCLGQALVAFNILTQTPRIGAEVRAVVARLQDRVAALRKDVIADKAARAAQPLDLKVRFAHVAAQACRVAAWGRLDAARRKFAPGRHRDPLTEAFHDAEAAAIPARFTGEAAFRRHIAEVIEATRVHTLLSHLGGFSKEV